MKNKLSIKNMLLLFSCLTALVAVFVMDMNPLHVGGITLAMGLTAGFTKVCQSNSGGAVRVWIANVADVASFTINAGTGAYSACTMQSGKVFYKFEFEQDSAFFKWIPAMSDSGSFSIDKSVEFYLKYITQTHRNALQDIADASACGMIVIVEDGNGQKWVHGYSEKFILDRPMKLRGGESNSGKVFSDPNGSNVILGVIDNEYPRQYTGTVPV